MAGAFISRRGRGLAGSKVGFSVGPVATRPTRTGRQAFRVRGHGPSIIT